MSDLTDWDVLLLHYRDDLAYVVIAQMWGLASRNVVAGMIYRERQRRGWTPEDARRYAKNTAPAGAPTLNQDGVGETPLSQEPAAVSTYECPPVLLQAAVFDLEVTDFGTEGYAGYCICCSILPLDSDTVTTLSIAFDERGDDRRLVREVVEALADYDILIGHNVAGFDLNWLHSRWLFHNARGSYVGDWRRWLYFDTYQHAKTSALKTRKGLGNLGDYFALGGEKTSIYKSSWSNVRSPYQHEFDATMQDVVYHCEQDVIMNRQLFDILWHDALARDASPLKISKWGIMQGVRSQAA